MQQKFQKKVPVPLHSQKKNEQKPIANIMYRSGRLGCFIFKEGNENPVDLRKIKVTGNPQYNKTLLKQDISDLFYEPKSDFEQMAKYVLIGVGILAVMVVVIIIVMKSNAPPPVVQPI